MKRHAWLLALFVACGLTSFAATYSLQDQSRPAASSNPAEILGGWLELLPGQLEQISSVDPDFPQRRDALTGELAVARERLADLFENPDSTDQQIREQVEKVISVHDTLERCVAEYLLAIRPHLSEAQRARLFHRCAEGVRRAGGWRWRHGWDGNGGEDAGRGRGHGRGRGAGGRGGGPPWRNGSGDRPGDSGE